jgi:hypothetical protein
MLLSAIKFLAFASVLSTPSLATLSGGSPRPGPNRGTMFLLSSYSEDIYLISELIMSRLVIMVCIEDLTPALLSKRNSLGLSPGPVCCDTVVFSNNPAAAAILSLLGIQTPGNAVTPVGLTCTPVTVVGVTETCGSSQVLVACSDNSHAELIAVGCVPILGR